MVQELQPLSSKKTSSRHVGIPVKIDTSFVAIRRQSPLILASVTNNSTDLKSVNRRHRHPSKSFEVTPRLVIISDTDQNYDRAEDRYFSNDDSEYSIDIKKAITQNLCQASAYQKPTQCTDELINRLDISDAQPHSSPNGLVLDTAVLRPLVIRSPTAISSTSLRSSPRLTNRLSYLEHVENLEAEEAKNAEEIAARQEDALLVDSIPSSRSPMSIDCLVSNKTAAMNGDNGSIKTTEACHTNFSPVYPSRRSSLSHAHIYSHSPAIVGTPPIPNLYKRLLRIFKPPSDVSDSDSGPTEQPSIASKPRRVRGQFGLLIGHEGCSDRQRSKGFSSKLKSTDNMVIVATPSSSSAPAITSGPTVGGKVQIHRLPESSGLRAKFFKMLSSPNLHGVVYPMGIPREPNNEQQGCSHCDSERLERDAPHSPYSPFPSDFEHEVSCPMSKRIRESNDRENAFVPSKPTRMPTLQSKYGIPTRELGAGTQAQVMLLRVGSSKRPKNHDAKPRQSQRTALSAEDGNPSDSLLSPHPRTGTMMTTTEDEVTPEQREVYRKKLLKRTSTAGTSIADGGMIYAIKKFRPPKATETHRQYLKKVCAEFCISTSMDHENIIRTIDLVRNQPGQDPFDDDVPEQQRQQYRNDHRRISRSSQQYENHGSLDNQDLKDDCRDCSCSRERPRRVRGVKSADDLLTQNSCQSPTSPTSPKHRSIPRRSVISKPQRKRSVDNLSNRRSITSGYDQFAGPRDPQYRCEQHSFQTEAQIAASKKTKQKQDQAIRQKELQRLKQQKQREKQQAKQLQMDQFPEYCMVMEFAAGGDLFNLLTTSYPPISLNEKYCLWRQLISGVQYMHSMGVAHRDLKPENILIDGTGRILKITDFGIANVFKSVGDPIPLSCSGIIGSEPYIAPEEFYKNEYDPRAVDVWACGVILYVMYYSAMPWARADRKKDARFARYINDIMAHRHGEPQRRLQFEQQHIRKYSAGSVLDGLQQRSNQFSYPQIEYLNKCSSLSSGSGSPCDSQGNAETESPSSSVSCSPVTPKSSTSVDKTEQNSSFAYNTFSYNGHIGGHEFLDKMEASGCRRIIYAILEPDARKRATIDQVANDDWVSKIRYCTDCVDKQEQQAAPGVNPSRYMDSDNGRLHHQHATPKKVKS
ncbi:serine/threonine-protein kinase HAL4/sat4 [Entomortierella beljakovae]|nr:serine/threonine-protein kinase HAL4/sat4 [Entomortierella beljakovae]